MQASFWKTVAVVGVIGVGTIAILEVQKRLGDSAATDEVSDDELAAAVEGAGERSVDATLERSEFEEMLTAGDGSEPTFDLSEPDQPEPGQLEPDQLEPAANLDPNLFAAAEPSPAVDTSVDVQNLSGGNPFFNEDPAPSTTGAAAAGEDIQQAQFKPQEEGSPFALLGAAEPEPVSDEEPPFTRDSAGDAEDFALFGGDSDSQPAQPQPGFSASADTAQPFTPGRCRYSAQ